MAKLTGKERKDLPTKDFACPKRSYPIDTKNRARDAMSRVSANGSPAVKAEVRRDVAEKYPTIKQSGPGKELERRLAKKDKW